MQDPKKKRLSYSGYSTYMTCPKKYDYHYNEKIRPDSEPFHLVFGSATDKALNEILLSMKEPEEPFFNNKKSTLNEIKNSALNEAAKELFRLFKKKILFSSADFDGEILTELTEEVMFQKLSKVGWKGSNPSDLASSLFQSITMGDSLTRNQYKALKYLVFFSSIEKIGLIIDAFNDYVVPRIKRIVSVQTHVKRGILDFEAELIGTEGIVVCDNKTAGRDYEQDAVLNSVQLAGYGAEVGAYIVFNKTVKKNRTKECSICKKNGTGQRHKTCDAVIDGVRCGGDWIETITPEIVPQIIIDKVPEHNRNMVETAFSETEKLIEQKVFPRNLNNCGKQYGSPCPYINLCWKNDKTGLKKEESK